MYDDGGVIGHGPPAGVNRPAMHTVAVAVRLFASALALTVNSVLRQTKNLLLNAASLLELDVDGVRGLMAHSDLVPHPVPSQFGAEREEKATELLLESLVEVKVDEGVVDVGAFGEEGGENKPLWSHVPVVLVENEEEGHDSVRGPGNHKTKADAEKHLEEEVR